MQRPAEGFRPLLDRRVVRSLMAFDRDYQSVGFDMALACQSFFNRAGYQPHLERGWQSNDGAIVFIGEHSSLLDGFALSLACPAGRDLRRIVFWPTGHVVGRHFARRNVLVWPRMSWTSFWNEHRSFKERLLYFITHRPGPFAYRGPWSRSGRHVDEICHVLRQGTCVSLFPSGVVGDTPWRSGIGAILGDYEQRREAYREPLYIAPVYVTWQTDNRVKVEAPLLAGADVLLRHLRRSGVPMDRRSVTQAVKEAYRSRVWPAEVIAHGFAA